MWWGYLWNFRLSELSNFISNETCNDVIMTWDFNRDPPRGCYLETTKHLWIIIDYLYRVFLLLSFDTYTCVSQTYICCHNQLASPHLSSKFNLICDIEVKVPLKINGTFDDYMSLSFKLLMPGTTPVAAYELCDSSDHGLLE